MGSNGIADSVQRFIRQHIHAVEQLEVLLFLRTQASREWTADEVARELRINEQSAHNRLEDLRGRGLLGTTDGHTFRYAPSAELARDVDDLARTYQERRVAVINLIFSRPIEGLTSFADAFKLFGKKEKP